MNKNFLSYEICERLKLLGFNEQCFGYYNKNEELITRTKLLRTNSEIKNVTAVLPSQALAFFREKFTVDGVVDYYPNVEKWGWYVRNLKLKATSYVNFFKIHSNPVGFKYDSYEQAQEFLIRYLITIAEMKTEEVMLLCKNKQR